VNFYSTYTSTVLGTQLLSEEKCFQKWSSEITYLLTYLLTYVFLRLCPMLKACTDIIAKSCLLLLSTIPGGPVEGHQPGLEPCIVCSSQMHQSCLHSACIQSVPGKHHASVLNLYTAQHTDIRCLTSSFQLHSHLRAEQDLECNRLSRAVAGVFVPVIRWRGGFCRQRDADAITCVSSVPAVNAAL